MRPGVASVADGTIAASETLFGGGTAVGAVNATDDSPGDAMLTIGGAIVLTLTNVAADRVADGRAV